MFTRARLGSIIKILTRLPSLNRRKRRKKARAKERNPKRPIRKIIILMSLMSTITNRMMIVLFPTIFKNLSISLTINFLMYFHLILNLFSLILKDDLFSR